MSWRLCDSDKLAKAEPAQICVIAFGKYGLGIFRDNLIFNIADQKSTVTGVALFGASIND